MNTTRNQGSSLETLSLAAAYYNRYPGEQNTFFLRFITPKDPNAVLQIALPQNMKVESYTLPPEIPPNIPSVTEEDESLIIQIPLGKYFASAKIYELTVKILIETFNIDHYLLVEARMVSGKGELMASESLQVAVRGKGSYLQYLPGIYNNDDFTSRFLMLFESFWKPINQQIDQIDVYFDPELTPPDFIPWLASWMGLAIDEMLPLNRVRQLLRQAMILFQRRGTQLALKTFLQIYTAGEVEIVEHQARNFVLEASSTLGKGIALGTENKPNTIAINLLIPEKELERSQYSPDVYQHKITDVVRSMVPAHTYYQVNCEFAPQPSG